MSSGCPPNFPYKVTPGETLFAIALRFKTTVAALIKNNPGINPDQLNSGQEILVPLTGQGEIYPVESGSVTRIFVSQLYKVVFLYPAGWLRVADERYEGPDGFFQVSAVKGRSLEEVCREEAFHILKPYGAKPGIRRLTIQQQQSCIIHPSADQQAEMKGQAVLIARYPQPVIISGCSYQFLVLWADKNHLQDLSSTLEFLFPSC
ncbi:MAG: LysM peptidoglycan-binding domain-containing protein [Bacillota bacterium]